MLGGVRTLLLHQEMYCWPTPITIPLVVPTVTLTLGPVPIAKSGSYTVSVSKAGSYTVAISKTAGA